MECWWRLVSVSCASCSSIQPCEPKWFVPILWQIQRWPPYGIRPTRRKFYFIEHRHSFNIGVVFSNVSRPSSPPNQPLYSHAKDPRIFMITADDLELTWGKCTPLISSTTKSSILIAIAVSQVVWVATCPNKFWNIHPYRVCGCHGPAPPKVAFWHFSSFCSITRCPALCSIYTWSCRMIRSGKNQTYKFECFEWCWFSIDRMLPAYRKCLLFMQKLRYFMTQEWVMDKSNMCAVYDRFDDIVYYNTMHSTQVISVFFCRMTDADHKFFPCDIRKFCWEEFRLNYHLGIMQHIGKETLDHFDDSRRRLRWFQIAHFIVLTIYYSTFAVITFYLSRFFGINDWLCDRWSQFFP